YCSPSSPNAAYILSLHDALPIFGQDSGDFSERELLYKVLFDMKQDMNDLKKLVLESFQSGGLNQNIMKKHQTLFEDMESGIPFRSEEHTSELQSRENLVCRLLLE